MLRQAIADKTDAGPARRSSTWLSGKLVPDPIILQIWSASDWTSPIASAATCSTAFRARWARPKRSTSILRERGTPLDAVLELHVDDEELVERLAGRGRDDDQPDDHPRAAGKLSSADRAAGRTTIASEGCCDTIDGMRHARRSVRSAIEVDRCGEIAAKQTSRGTSDNAAYDCGSADIRGAFVDSSSRGVHNVRAILRSPREIGPDAQGRPAGLASASDCRRAGAPGRHHRRDRRRRSTSIFASTMPFRCSKACRARCPFPAVTCISVNEEVVHGIPGQRVLNEGDIVSVDTGCKLDGWCGDSADHASGRQGRRPRCSGCSTSPAACSNWRSN